MDKELPTPRTFRGSDLSRVLLYPIVVNLGTALILFLCVVNFKSCIYKKLGLTVDDYPIFAVYEPYTKDDNGFVYIDIFIVNRSMEPQTKAELWHWMETHEMADPETGATIILEWTGPEKCELLLNDEADKNFNERKSTSPLPSLFQHRYFSLPLIHTTLPASSG